MEPTIYKPSIYKGAGIYNQGQGGGGGGSFVGISEKNFVVWPTSNNKTHINITDEFISGVPSFGAAYSDSWRWAVEPLDYDNKVTWDDLSINDEIEINAIVNCPRIGSNRTDFFGPSNKFGLNDSDSYKFEINNYDGKSWFYILGNDRGGLFDFDFNIDVTINLVIKKIDSEKFNFVCKYNGLTKYSGNFAPSSSIRSDMVLPMFGNASTSSSMMCACKLLLGSFIRYNDNILFGKQL